MFSKRTSPNVCSAFGGADTSFGVKSRIAEISLLNNTTKNQGNRCGHDPYKPRYYVAPAHHKKRKPFLDKAANLIAEAYNDRLRFDIAHLFYHKDKLNKNGGYRKVRSEKVESLTTRVGRCILHHVNLGSMTLGFFAKELGDFFYFSYEYIAKQIGAALSQVKRAMAVFISAGYIEVTKRHKRLPNGNFIALTPIIKINPKLFIDLGFDQKEVMFHIERAEKELEKEQKKVEYKKETQNPKLFQKKISKVAENALKEIMQNLAIRKKPPS